MGAHGLVCRIDVVYEHCGEFTKGETAELNHSKSRQTHPNALKLTETHRNSRKLAETHSNSPKPETKTEPNFRQFYSVRLSRTEPEPNCRISG